MQPLFLTSSSTAISRAGAEPAHPTRRRAAEGSRRTRSATWPALLALGALASVAPKAQAQVPPGPSEGACVSLIPQPPRVLGVSPIACKCGGGVQVSGSLSLPVGPGGAHIDVTPSPGGSNGGLVCFQTVYDFPPHHTTASNGPYLVTPKALPVKAWKGSCDLSGCGSALWGLVRWGGPACDYVEFDSQATVTDFEITGFCEPLPQAGLPPQPSALGL
jgi:hypothetical protein